MNPLTVENIKLSKYYAVPKALFAGKYKVLNNDARLVYAFLVERGNIAIREGWYNNKREIYVRQSRDYLSYTMNLCKSTISKIFKALQNVGLIKCERIYCSQVDNVYLFFPEQQSVDQMEMDLEKKEKQITDQIDQEGEKKLPVNISDRKIKLLEKIKKNLGYEDTIQWYEQRRKDPGPIDPEEIVANERIYKEIFTTITSVVTEERAYNVNGLKYSAKQLREEFSSLTWEHIESVLEGLLKTNTSLKNRKSYIVACLVNSKSQVEFDAAKSISDACRDFRSMKNENETE